MKNLIKGFFLLLLATNLYSNCNVVDNKKINYREKEALIVSYILRNYHSIYREIYSTDTKIYLSNLFIFLDISLNEENINILKESLKKESEPSQFSQNLLKLEFKK